jgi:hypothetical protein
MYIYALRGHTDLSRMIEAAPDERIQNSLQISASIDDSRRGASMF